MISLLRSLQTQKSLTKKKKKRHKEYVPTDELDKENLTPYAKGMRRENRPKVRHKVGTFTQKDPFLGLSSTGHRSKVKVLRSSLLN